MERSGRWGERREGDERDKPKIDPALAPYLDGLYRLYGILKEQLYTYSVPDGTKYSSSTKKAMPKSKGISFLNLTSVFAAIDGLGFSYPLTSRLDIVEDLFLIHGLFAGTISVNANAKIPKHVADYMRREVGDRPIEIDTMMTILLEDRGIQIHAC